MRKIKKFPIGGTHLPEFKSLSSHRPIDLFHPSGRVVIPLRQHLGMVCAPVVHPGDSVTIGQVIGQQDQGLSALIHSSVNGRVAALEDRQMAEGSTVPCVLIDCDNEPQKTRPDDAALIFSCGGPDDAVPDAATVVAAVKQAGVVGMGGAAFPTHIKLQPKPDTPIDTVIVNGAECEPYITADDRLMQEHADVLFRGLEIIRKTVGAQHGIVACEINKPQALGRLFDAAEKWDHLEAVRLDTRYPHGAEKHLIKAVLNREVPVRQLPMSVGVVVNNVQTTIAIALAVDRGRALTARVLTVSGSAVREPGNFFAPVGTPIGALIEAAGGPSCSNYTIIIGGPMTGFMTRDQALPVTKSTSGIVLLKSEEYADRRAEVCIRCGQCVAVCPMYLQPNRITAFVYNDMVREAEEFGLNDCILCGACAYVCPAHRPLVQWLRAGKMESARRAREIHRTASKEV